MLDSEWRRSYLTPEELKEKEKRSGGKTKPDRTPTQRERQRQRVLEDEVADIAKRLAVSPERASDKPTQSKGAFELRERAPVLEAAGRVGVSVGDLAGHMRLSRQRVYQLANGSLRKAERVRVAVTEILKERGQQTVPVPVRERIALAQSEPPRAAKGVRLIDAIAARLRAVQASGSRKSIPVVESSLGVFAAYVGDVTVEEAASRAVEFLSEREEHTKRNTFGAYVTHVRVLFRLCVERGWLERNPLEGVLTPRREVPVRQPLTDEEISALLEAANHWDRAMITLILGSGMTIGELERLRWSDVHDDYIVVHGRSGKPRALAPGRAAMAILYNLPRKGERVFPFTDDHIRYMMPSLSHRSGIGVHARQLRDTFAYRFLAATDSVEMLSEILGHKNLDSAAMLYLQRRRRGRGLAAQRRYNPADAFFDMRQGRHEGD